MNAIDIFVAVAILIFTCSPKWRFAMRVLSVVTCLVAFGHVLQFTKDDNFAHAHFDSQVTALRASAVQERLEIKSRLVEPDARQAALTEWATNYRDAHRHLVLEYQAAIYAAWCQSWCPCNWHVYRWF
jgi:hypothetical protein